MTQHTPVPWIYDNNTDHTRVFDIYGQRPDGEYDPKTAEAFTEANAEFIVRACNSHDELLEALRIITRLMDGETMFPGPVYLSRSEANQIVDAVLKATET